MEETSKWNGVCVEIASISDFTYKLKKRQVGSNNYFRNLDKF